jgi:hypothetical protein
LQKRRVREVAEIEGTEVNRQADPPAERQRVAAALTSPTYLATAVLAPVHRHAELNESDPREDSRHLAWPGRDDAPYEGDDQRAVIASRREEPSARVPIDLRREQRRAAEQGGGRNDHPNGRMRIGMRRIVALSIPYPQLRGSVGLEVAGVDTVLGLRRSAR